MREKEEYFVCDRRSVSCLFAFLHLYLSVCLSTQSLPPPTLPPSFLSPTEFNRAPRVVTLPSPTVYGLEDAQEGEAGRFLSSFR